MKVELVTKEDLQAFRLELVRELGELLAARVTVPPAASWLKSREVKKLLNISTNTLQGLRISGKLHPSKLGGTYYYSYEEISRTLNPKNPAG